MVIRQNKCGLLSSAHDPDAFAENVRILALDEELRKSLGANAKRAALANFTWAVGASKAEQIYAQALDGTTA